MITEKGNKIGETGARMISEVLKINTSLTSLNVGGEKMSSV